MRQAAGLRVDAGLLREPPTEYRMQVLIDGATYLTLELASRLVSAINGKWMSELLLDRGIGISFGPDPMPPHGDGMDGRRLGVDFVKRLTPYVVRVAGTVVCIDGKRNLSERVSPIMQCAIRRETTLMMYEVWSIAESSKEVDAGVLFESSMKMVGGVGEPMRLSCATSVSLLGLSHMNAGRYAIVLVGVRIMLSAVCVDSWNE